MHLHVTSALSSARRHAAVAAAALLASGAAALGQPASASAGGYVHAGCVAGAGISDAYGGWGPHGPQHGGAVNVNNCDWGGLHTELYASGGATVPNYSPLGWDYQAPANTRISGFTGTLQGWARGYDGTTRGILTVDGSTSGRLKLYTSGDSLYPTGASLAFGGMDDASLSFSAACDGTAPCSTNTAWFSLSSPRVRLDDATPPAVGSSSGTVRDDPKWVGTKELAYTASDAGGGVARLRVSVDGAQTADHVIDAFNGHCSVLGTEGGAWVFGYPKPCPGGVSDTERIDSTAIEDGWHTVTVKVLDAAQREATVYTGTKLVANHPPVNTAAPAYTIAALASAPVTGVQLAVRDAEWTGPNLTFVRSWQRCDSAGASCVSIPGAAELTYAPTADDVGHRLRFAVVATNVADSVTSYSPTTGLVTAPSSQGETTPKPADGADGSDGAKGADGASAGGSLAAISLPGLSSSTTSATTHVLLGHVVGEADGVACPGDRATLRLEHVAGGRLALRYGRVGTVQAELTCTVSGKAIAGAKLAIATKVVGRAAVAADVTTDGAGHATLRIAKGASRGVTVGYKMYSDDPIARATATLKVVVTGQVSIAASRRHLRNGQAVRLRGRLAGGLVPKRGVDLAVQWKDGRRWRPFAQIRTDRKGRFSYAYKFTRTRHALTYALRVQVGKGQVDYPFAAAASRAVKVTVAP